MNFVTFVGFLVEGFDKNCENCGQTIYRGTVEIEREKGNVDRLPILVHEGLIKHRDIEDWCGSLIRVDGAIESRNEDNGRVRLYVMAHRVEIVYGTERINEVELSGFLCKVPRHRITPNGFEITDMLLAVNRPSGKPDYIPVITWGRNARNAKLLETGSFLHVNGRFQSRNYIKKLEDGTATIRTTYEVSARSIEEWEDN